jgi:hypothetical protein
VICGWRSQTERQPTPNKPRAFWPGALCGAGDGNRTRALSLGITVSRAVVGALTWETAPFGCPDGGPNAPPLTVIYRLYGHGTGTLHCSTNYSLHRRQALRPCSRALFSSIDSWPR